MVAVACLVQSASEPWLGVIHWEAGVNLFLDIGSLQVGMGMGLNALDRWVRKKTVRFRKGRKSGSATMT